MIYLVRGVQTEIKIDSIYVHCVSPFHSSAIPVQEEVVQVEVGGKCTTALPRHTLLCSSSTDSVSQTDSHVVLVSLELVGGSSCVYS